MRCTQELPLSHWHHRPIQWSVSLCHSWPSKSSWPDMVCRCLPCLLKAPNLVAINRKLHKVYILIKFEEKTWDEYISTELCRTRIIWFLCPPGTKITPESDCAEAGQYLDLELPLQVVQPTVLYFGSYPSASSEKVFFMKKFYEIFEEIFEY